MGFGVSDIGIQGLWLRDCAWDVGLHALTAQDFRVWSLRFREAASQSRLLPCSATNRKSLPKVHRRRGQIIHESLYKAMTNEYVHVAILCAI